MKKGFTLIELVGVIVIIGLMVTIVVPAVNGAVKRGKEQTDKQTKESIELAAQNWAIENKDKIKNTCNVKLSTLQTSGFLDTDMSTTLSNGTSIASCCVQIKPTVKGTKTTYSYSFITSCSATTCN